MPEKTVRILGIAPYEGMKTAMLNTAEEYKSVHMDVYTADMEEGADIVRNVFPGTYDCIISRGGTAAMIREVTDIPVVEVPISMYDVLRIIKLAENYSNRYAVVGFASITKTAHTLCDLMQYQIDIITISQASDVHPTLTRLQDEGYQMIIGDMVTHTQARRMGMDAFLLTSGIESLHNAFDQALQLCTVFHELRMENLFMRSLTQQENGNICVFDENKDVCFSLPADIPQRLIQQFRSHISEISSGGTNTFYFNDKGTVYKINGQHIRNGSEYYNVFCYSFAKTGIRTEKTGIHYYTRTECQMYTSNSFYSISGAMGELSDQISSIGTAGQPVMITGETGTGKDQIARYIYLHGQRTAKSLVVINCEIISEKIWNYLINNPNSPVNDNGGTIYFQNAGSLSAERTNELIDLIQATNLSRRIKVLMSCTCDTEGNISDDCRKIIMILGCRSLHLPTLRSRSDEIKSLASIYLDSLNAELGKQISGFEPHAAEQLRQFSWPGNYTQFKQVLYELAVQTSSPYIRSSSVTEALHKQRLLMRVTSREAEDRKETRTLDEIIYDSIEKAIGDNNGNQAAAARQLGISRTTLWRHYRRNQ